VRWRRTAYISQAALAGVPRRASRTSSRDEFLTTLLGPKITKRLFSFNMLACIQSIVY
jgi:hypothetical protein